MDAAEFLQAIPDLTPILRDDEDTRQVVLLRLWERRDSIRNMPHYARRAAKRAANDASERRGRSGERLEPLEGDHICAAGSPSSLDAMLDAEDRVRVREAASRLPRCQRDAVVFEIDPARQSGATEAKPPPQIPPLQPL